MPETQTEQTPDWFVQSVIADDPYMRNGCATDMGIDPDTWTLEWRRVWAAAPGWWQQWKSSQDAQPPVADPGKNPGVIPDAQIEAQVQAMMPFTRVADHAPHPTQEGVA